MKRGMSDHGTTATSLACWTADCNSAQECWTERDGAPRTAPTRSVFPDDALAVIYKPARNRLDCLMV